MTRLLCLLSFCVCASPVWAWTDYYECTIEEMLRAGGPVTNRLLNSVKANKVIVERDTGVIKHPTWFVSPEYIDGSLVLDRGNDMRYFKAFTYTSLRVFVAITVDESASSQKKPMSLLVNQDVYTGYCY